MPASRAPDSKAAANNKQTRHLLALLVGNVVITLFTTVLLQDSPILFVISGVGFVMAVVGLVGFVRQRKSGVTNRE